MVAPEVEARTLPLGLVCCDRFKVLERVFEEQLITIVLSRTDDCCILLPYVASSCVHLDPLRRSF